MCKENETEKPSTSLDVIEETDSKLIEDILKETDVSKLKDLTHLFNAFQAKRQVLRINALNDVQDSLIKQMADRLAMQPHNFANADISAWMKVVQQVLDASQKGIEEIDNIPTITYQQNNQINVTVGTELSRDSRDKVFNILQQLMKNVEDTSVLNKENEIIIDDEKEDDSNGRE